MYIINCLNTKPKEYTGKLLETREFNKMENGVRLIYKSSIFILQEQTTRKYKQKEDVQNF